MRYQLNLDSIRQKLTKQYLIDGILLLLLFALGYFVLAKIGFLLQEPAVKELIVNAGLLGPVIFAILYEISLIIAPLPGFPLLIMGFAIFGIEKAIIFNYFLCLIGGAINFYIARRWGRNLIRRLIGTKGLSKVDSHVADVGTEMLILIRLFDGFLFEWISYAAGLTQMGFKRYMIITAIFSIPYNLIALYFAQRINNLGELFISLSIIYYVTLSLPFLYFLTKKLLHK